MAKYDGGGGGAAPTPFPGGTMPEGKDAKLAGPLYTEPRGSGNLGAEPVSGPKHGFQPNDPLGYLSLKKKGG